MWVSVKCMCKFLTRFKQVCWFFKVHVMVSGYSHNCYKMLMPMLYLKMTVCVCVWLVIVLCRRKRLILITVSDMKQLFSFLELLKAILHFFGLHGCFQKGFSHNMCVLAFLRTQEIWSQRSISAWSVECVTLIIPSLTWLSLKQPEDQGNRAHCQIIWFWSFRLMSQTFFRTFFSPVQSQWVLWPHN